MGSLLRIIAQMLSPYDLERQDQLFEKLNTTQIQVFTFTLNFVKISPFNYYNYYVLHICSILRSSWVGLSQMRSNIKYPQMYA